MLQDLYAADEDNRAFLHARFGLGDDPLQPYKKIINRWLRPDVFRGQQASVSRAKGAITRYRKALSDPVRLAELMVFYCEQATGFCQAVDHRDTAYIEALVRMFKQALKATGKLTGKVQNGFLTKLEGVRNIGRNLGNGVGVDMDVLFAELVPPFQPKGVGGKMKKQSTRDGTSC